MYECRQILGGADDVGEIPMFERYKYMLWNLKSFDLGADFSLFQSLPVLSHHAFLTYSFVVGHHGKCSCDQT